MLTLSIITVNYRSADALQRLLASVETLGDPTELEWIAVNNSPEQGGLAEKLKFPARIGRHLIIENGMNAGFGAACNQGSAQATGDVLLFLNPDCQFSGGSFQKILKRMSADNRTGAVGPKIRDTEGNLEFSRADFPGILSEAKLKWEKRRAAGSASLRARMEERFQKARRVDWVTGGAMFMRKAVFDEMGGFDEGYFLYFEDADLGKRLKDAGYENYYDPSFEIIHQRGVSMANSDSDISSLYRKSQVRYYEKHKSRFSQFVLKNYLRITGKI